MVACEVQAGSLALSGDPDKPPEPSPDDPLEPIVVSVLRYPLDSPEFADAASLAGPAEIAEAQRQINGKSSADVHLRFRDVTPARRGADGLYRVLVHTDRLGRLHRPKAADSVRRERPRHARTDTEGRRSDRR